MGEMNMPERNALLVTIYYNITVIIVVLPKVFENGTYKFQAYFLLCF